MRKRRPKSSCRSFLRTTEYTEYAEKGVFFRVFRVFRGFFIACRRAWIPLIRLNLKHHAPPGIGLLPEALPASWPPRRGTGAANSLPDLP